jgi:hypothetical protein
MVTMLCVLQSNARCHDTHSQDKLCTTNALCVFLAHVIVVAATRSVLDKRQVRPNYTKVQ